LLKDHSHTNQLIFNSLQDFLLRNSATKKAALLKKNGFENHDFFISTGILSESYPNNDDDRNNNDTNNSIEIDHDSLFTY
jgi:hypothetical protein